ncbi:MAG: methyl-accepting chemotaxis protein, partial [Methylococcaceae bacterium]
MQELTSTVTHNTENAKQANVLAMGATETANRGVSVVKEVVSTMDNINESSLRIVDIISVIDDIAFQTNILALNAAVEAARAGDQGKGFAVVAIEVRNLAQRAANAAGEIKRLISDSVERVSGGSKQVAEAGQTMQDIVNAIQGVTTIISEIASASDEQSAGISQVGQAIASMDDVTQQNAALVEQVAATAESLETQTQNLAKELAHFKTGNERGQRNTVSSVKSTPAKKVISSPKEVEKEVFLSGNDDWEEF